MGFHQRIFCIVTQITQRHGRKTNAKVYPTSDQIWYTAWVDAGKPDLLAMEQPELLKRTNKQYKKDVKIWQGGQLPYQYMEKEY